MKNRISILAFILAILISFVSSAAAIAPFESSKSPVAVIAGQSYDQDVTTNFGNPSQSPLPMILAEMDDSEKEVRKPKKRKDLKKKKRSKRANGKMKDNKRDKKVEPAEEDKLL